ncbi:MAG: hypothetical protein ACLVKA_01545 [Collinsella aerofaciens]
MNEWIHEKNVCSFDEMTNLPVAMREKLSERFSFNVPVELVKQVSKDGSRSTSCNLPMASPSRPLACLIEASWPSAFLLRRAAP